MRSRIFKLFSSCVGCTSVISISIGLVSFIFIMTTIGTKLHGVHETDFIFTGDYKVKTEINKDEDVYYLTSCESATKFGYCYYDLSHKTSVYQNAMDYGAEHCIVNTTMCGYIINETHDCVKEYPNERIHNFVIILIVCSSFVLFTFVSIHVCSLDSVIEYMKDEPQKEESKEIQQKLIEGKKDEEKKEKTTFDGINV